MASPNYSAQVYDGNDKLTPLLVMPDGKDLFPNKQQQQRQKKLQFGYKLKLASLLSSLFLGFCAQLTATLSSTSLFVTAGLVASLLQACCTSKRFRDALSSLDVFIWLAVSLLSFQSGLFFAWIVVDYWLDSVKRVSPIYFMVELLCLVKFLLLTWIVILETPQTGHADDVSTPTPDEVKQKATMKSDFRLRLFSLVFSYVLGYFSELTGTLVASSICANLLYFGGTIAALLQAYITSRNFSSKAGPINLILWISAAVLCFQGGFYCAWSFTDYLFGMQQQLLKHFILEVIYVSTSLMATWVMDVPSSTIINDKKDSTATAQLLVYA